MCEKSSNFAPDFKKYNKIYYIMKKFNCFIFMILATCVLSVHAQQLPNSGFEDWSGAKFDNKEQPASWHASNVEQVGFKFNFITKESGHTGVCAMVQDKEVGAFGITEVGPGYMGLGTAWQWLDGINTNTATAGMCGGISFTHRPDTLSVWIRRTGNNTDKEDYHILYYAWSGTAKSNKYKAKNGSCSPVEKTDDESDIRLALDGNECGTVQKANQVSEGWWRARNEYNEWTNIRVPIYYMNNDVPEKVGVIFSAGNYPNFRANSGLYSGNSLYVDDIELIYTSKIDALLIDGKEWRGFDPNSTEEQTYSLGEKATVMPTLQAMRGRGSLTNARGTVVNFPGRVLSGSEITIKEGQIDGAATEITVNSPNAKPMTYKIKFVRAASTNSRLAGIQVNGAAISGFNPYTMSYNVALPYGTTATPVISVEQAEDAQTVQITQPTSTTGKATIVVTAADKKTKSTYTIQFSVAALADNTLQDILVNGESLAGFTPGQTVYRVSLPLGTSTMPTVKAVSRYKEGEQTIKYTAPDKIDGGTYQIAVTTPGNQTAKTYKLNFKLEASTYSFLKSLKMGDYITNFEPNALTYYVNLPMGTTALPEIVYEKGDAYQTVTIENGGLDGTTRVIVTPASGVEDQTIYKIVVSTVKSEISSLKNIYVGGVALPDFNAQKTSYVYQLPIGTSELPAVTVEKGDEYEDVKIVTGGMNGTTRITVTAGNGSTTIYQIAFSVMQATDPSLKMIYVDGEELSGFDPEKTEYTINLSVGASARPAFTWTQHDDYQTVTLREPSGVEGDYRITVKPQSGATRTYILHVVVAQSSNTNLANIVIAGCDDFVFDAAQHEYTYILPEGVSQIPEVSFVKAEESQRVISMLSDQTQTIRVMAESGASSVYTITFVVQKSTNAFLKMIYLDGKALAGFQEEKLTGYTYVLAGNQCPAVTVDKADDRQQVNILSPVAEGQISIIVQPESGGSRNVYYIDVVKEVSSDVHLSSILVDGQQIAGWDETQYAYTVSYSGEQPEVTYVAREGQTVTKLQDGNLCTLLVRYGEDEARYTITMQREYDSRLALKNILLDGNAMAEFVPTQLEYTLNLPAGATLPKVGYEAEATQTVMMGETAPGVTAIRVMAENGDVQTYTVRMNVAKYDDPTLVSLMLDGVDVLADFNGEGVLSRMIEKGDELPAITYVKRDEQATVSLKTTALQQQVLVRAESGASKLYTINYTEHDETNALLSDIRIYENGHWASLPSFDKNTYDYTYDLVWNNYATRPKVVPCVWPVSDRPNQVVTITYGGVNDNTILEVLAEDGQMQRYTIRFTRAASQNTQLGSLEIGFEAKDVTRNEHVVELAYEDDMPQVEFTVAEAEQTIEYYAASRYEDSRIVVTAENGDKRTYTIHFAITEPEGENVIKSIAYSYKTKASETKQGTIAAPVVGENIVDLPYGATDFVIESVEKNYTEQSFALLQGGVRRSSVVIVMANRSGVADARYEVKVRQPEFETAGKLRTLTFMGASVPNFQPYVYNYVVRTSKTPTAADFAGVAYDGKAVTKSAIDHKKKQITLSVADGETYSICWFYEHTDWFDFSQEWVKTADDVPYNSVTLTGGETITKVSATGMKPSNEWMVPADYFGGVYYNAVVSKFTCTTGNEVVSGGNKAVKLQTIRSGATNSSVPGMMTLGEMSVYLTTGANPNHKNKSSVTKDATVGAEFRNTPEALAFRVNPMTSTNISAFKMWLTMSDGTTYKESNFSGTFDVKNKWQDVRVPISYDGVNVVNRFNIMLSSCDQENVREYEGGTVYESSVVYDAIRFVYNSALSEVYADGQKMTKEGNRFTLEVAADYTRIPSLSFVGEVHDQMQTIEWLNDGEWINGELTAKVTNYGENGQDTTIYTVALTRAAVMDMTVDVKVGETLPTYVSDGQYHFALPNGARRLPNLTIEPKSIHQQVGVSKQDWTYTVTVKNEVGETATYTYTFVEEKSDDATLVSLSGVNGFVSDKFDYTISAVSMPQVFTFGKTSEGQIVDAKNDGSKLTVEVTAEDGVTKNTYTVTLDKQAPTTSGMLDEIRLNAEPVSGFRSDKLDYTIDEVLPTSFVASDQLERVVEKVYMDSVLLMVGRDNVNVYKLATSVELSGNAYLRAIRVNKENLADFEPTSTLPYMVKTNEELDVEFVPQEAEQTIQLSLADTLDGYRLQAVVTAENGRQFSYIVIVRPDKSSNADLAEIRVDGAVLDEFLPNKFNYTVTLPTASPKTMNPQYPSISYLPASAGSKVTTEWATTLGGENLITVLSEDGTTEQTYSITVDAEPSHCLDLTAIIINGVPVANFKPGRTFYSAQISGEDVTVEYSTEDAFQTVTVRTAPELGALSRIIEVKAEDGQVREYELEIWKQTASNNANLSAIMLDGVALANFDEKIYTYSVSMMGTTRLPDISARLQEDGQTLSFSEDHDARLLTVTAPDGVTTNVYRINFIFEKSDVKSLQMIYLNGDSLAGFDPNNGYYMVELPIGTQKMPEVFVQKGEVHQLVADPIVDGNRITIDVQAENGAMMSYVLQCVFLRSAVDTLQMLYLDGMELDGFDAHRYYYTYALPVGTTRMPEVSWLEGDGYQTISVDTIASEIKQQILQVVVAAENGAQNAYTLRMDVTLSTVDTLAMIYVDGRELDSFDARVLNYTYVRAYGDSVMPKIDYLSMDTLQTITVDTLDNAYAIRVQAEAGQVRTYTVTFTNALSDNVSLRMISLDGSPLSTFDAEQLTYSVRLEGVSSPLPRVTAERSEESQRVDVSYDGDKAYVKVVAENGDVATYVITFLRTKSDNALLAAIMVDESELPDFESTTFDYAMTLPYGTKDLPTVTAVSVEKDAQVVVSQSGMVVTVEVTAPDGETMLEYTIAFTVALNSDCKLTDLRLSGRTLDNFDPDSTLYVVRYELGTKESDLPGVEAISYTASDSLATVVLQAGDDHELQIIVRAQDGESSMTYRILQQIAKSDNCYLKAVFFGEEEFTDFDPEQTEYTYLLTEGQLAPMIIPVPDDERATADTIIAIAGDTVNLVRCYAEDGSVRTYTFRFPYSTINNAQVPTSDDVLAKHLRGSMQYVFATVRNDVTVGLYDQYGHLVALEKVPVANPNAVQVVETADGMERLLDITDPSQGVVLEIYSSQVFYYVFYESKRVIQSGKIYIKGN